MLDSNNAPVTIVRRCCNSTFSSPLRTKEDGTEHLSALSHPLELQTVFHYTTLGIKSIMVIFSFS